jgi:hypothetical protein
MPGNFQLQLPNYPGNGNPNQPENGPSFSPYSPNTPFPGNPNWNGPGTTSPLGPGIFNMQFPQLQNIPGNPLTTNYNNNDWAANWRKYGSLQNQNLLRQMLDTTRANAARTGISNSGFINSMQVPAFESYSKNMTGMEADIGRAEMEAQMAREGHQLTRDLNSYETDPWDLGFKLAGALAMFV